jgi:O-antigen/teichoic acid export membrane protein
MPDERATRRRENYGTGFIVVATAFGAVAVLGFQALASRTLGTVGFAPIAVLWTVMFLIYTVLMIPAEQHLTRALVVSRDASTIARVRRDMLGAYALALVLGVGFVALTLDRFFEGDVAYILITAGIMVTRSVMSVARGSVAGHRRFGAYAATVALEATTLLLGGILMATTDGSGVAFGVVLVIAPLAPLLTRPFAERQGSGDIPEIDAQPGSFLAWLIVATTASQLIIAGGPIAVGFIGGSAAAVSIFFTSFALLRGPVTSAYNLVARVLPDFTKLAESDNPARLWRWPARIAAAGLGVAVLGAVGAGLLLGPIIDLIYGPEFVPPTAAAVLGGFGVGLGLGALFTTQVYSAAALGRRLASGWLVGLVVAILTLFVSSAEPVVRVALAFTLGEASGLIMLSFVLVVRNSSAADSSTV